MHLAKLDELFIEPLVAETLVNIGQFFVGVMDGCMGRSEFKQKGATTDKRFVVAFEFLRFVLEELVHDLTLPAGPFNKRLQPHNDSPFKNYRS
jgi:hypothetical protein